MPKLNNPINPRGWSRADMGIDHLDSTQLAGLNKSFEKDLLNQIGLPLNDEGAAPKTNGIPRLFAVTTNAKGEEEINDLSKSPLPKSPEFWRQVQLGNVFAYPAGASKPVQLQVQKNGMASMLAFSKPVDSKELPSPPAKPLGFWKRAAWLFSFGNAFDKQRREYNARIANAEATGKKFSEFEGKRKTGVETEHQDAEHRKAELREIERKQELKSHFQSAEKHMEENSIGIKQVTDIYGPVPRYDARFDRDDKSTGSYGLYNQKEFNSLVGYKDLDPKSIPAGDGSKSFTDEEFAAVAMFASCDPKYAKTAVLMQRGDRFTEQGLRDLGFPEKDIPVIETSQACNFYAQDLFIQPPRSGSGKFFKDVCNMGKKDAYEAFKDYKNGSKAKLAALIAKGVNYAARDIACMDEAKMSTQTRANCVMSGKLLDLMEKDPELKTLALQQGMDPSKLKTVEGAKVLIGFGEEARNSEKVLAEYAAEEQEPVKPVKRLMLKNILRERIANTKLVAENTTTNPQTDEKRALISMNLKQADSVTMKGYNKNPDTRPDPGKGKIWADSQIALLTGVAMAYNHQPSSVQELTDAQNVNKIDQIAEEIIDKYKLDELPVNDLAKKFSYRENKDIKLSKEIAEAEQKLFAPKNVNGPQPAPVRAPGLQNGPVQGQIQNGFDGIHA